MRTLSNPELAFLAMLGHHELTEKVLRLYANKTYLFTEMFCPHLNMMWNAFVATLKRNKAQYGLKLSPDIIAASLAEAVQADRTLPEEMREKCDDILQRLQAGQIPDTETGTRLVGNLVQLEANRRLMAKINANEDLLSLQQSLDASKKVMTDLAPKQKDDAKLPAIMHPFRDIEKLAKHVVLVPTGINWLDDVSSGGGRGGELWLILGKPSGGKSVCAVQYACAQALMGNDTLWVTYEQSLEGDLAERMIANITDTSLDEIRDIGFTNLDQSIQDKFWAAVAGVDDHLISLDMTLYEQDPGDPDDYGGMMSVWKSLKKLKAEGQHPKTIIVDWFGSMMTKIASNLGYDLSACYRFKAQEEIDIALKMAREEDVLIIFFHQLDAKAADMRPTFLASAARAQDMHNLQNFFTLVFVIGVLDVNNVCYFHSAKARKSAKVVRTLRLIGDKAKFVKEDGWMPNRDGNFFRPGDAGSGTADFRGAAEEYSREIE